MDINKQNFTGKLLKSSNAGQETQSVCTLWWEKCIGTGTLSHSSSYFHQYQITGWLHGDSSSQKNSSNSHYSSGCSDFIVAVVMEAAAAVTVQVTVHTITGVTLSIQG